MNGFKVTILLVLNVIACIFFVISFPCLIIMVLTEKYYDIIEEIEFNWEKEKHKK